MTDPELAHRTYIEPLTKDISRIISKERPMRCCDGRWTDGAESGCRTSESGILEKYKVEMIGASLRAIKVAEDRLWFKDACRRLASKFLRPLCEQCEGRLRLCDQLGFPLVIRTVVHVGGTAVPSPTTKEEFAKPSPTRWT